MTGAELREQLEAAVLRAGPICDTALAVDALLPVVKAFARAALLAAAAEQKAEAENVYAVDGTYGSHQGGHRCAADFLERRADLLTPTHQAP